MHPDHTRPMTARRMLRISGSIVALAGLIALAVYVIAGWRIALQLGLVLLIVAVVWLAKACFAGDEPMRANQLRYVRAFFPAIAVYLVMLFAFKPLLGVVASVWLRALIALLPVLPIAFIVRAMVRKLLGNDELQRRMQLEAISIASLSVGLLSFAAGFMHMAGVFHIDNALVLVLPALFLAYGLALWWVRRRYQGR